MMWVMIMMGWTSATVVEFDDRWWRHLLVLVVHDGIVLDGRTVLFV
jgi:hypothetical protein